MHAHLPEVALGVMQHGSAAPPSLPSAPGLSALHRLYHCMHGVLPMLPQVMAEPVNDNQRLDWERWLPGVRPGEVCAGPHNPLVWEHGS